MSTPAAPAVAGIPRTIEVAGDGTGTLSFALPPGVTIDVESVYAAIDATAAGATTATLTIAEQGGAVIAAKAQTATVDAGVSGSATWALRLGDDGGGGGGQSVKTVKGGTVVDPTAELLIGTGINLFNLGAGIAELTVNLPAAPGVLGWWVAFQNVLGPFGGFAAPDWSHAGTVTRGGGNFAGISVTSAPDASLNPSRVVFTTGSWLLFFGVDGPAAFPPGGTVVPKLLAFAGDIPFGFFFSVMQGGNVNLATTYVSKPACIALAGGSGVVRTFIDSPAPSAGEAVVFALRLA